MVFGIGEKKDKTPPRVGAKEKREMAAAVKHGGTDQIRSRREGQKDDPTILLIIIWSMAVMGALLAMQGVFAKGAPLHLDIPLLQKWLLSMPPPALTGDRDMDMLVAAAVRGTAFFLLCGVVPGAARLLSSLDKRDNARPHILFFWLAGALVAGVVLAAAKTL